MHLDTVGNKKNTNNYLENTYSLSFFSKCRNGVFVKPIPEFHPTSVRKS